MKKEKLKLSKKGKKLFRVYAFSIFSFAVMFGTSMTVFAADDPMAVVNNLSNFIFGLIRAIGMFARKLTVINVRTDSVLFQITGNFSVEKGSDGDLAVIGEDDNGKYYKHFICLADEITYVVEDLGSTGVNKYKYEINFNPNMILPVQPTIID